MTPCSRAALAVALAAAFAAPAGAVVCLPAGLKGPDVPGCTPPSEKDKAEDAVGQNLLALSGQAAAEQFNEREAIDAAGPLLPRTTAPARRREALRARDSAPETSAVTTLLAPLKDAKAEELDGLAGAIVRGTGDSFSQIEAAGRKTPAAPAALPARALTASSAAPPAPGSQPPAQRADFGPTIRDEGRSAFDGASSALPDDVASPAAPITPTARQCTILHPCKNAD